jgi:hypothetical protein
MRKKILVAKALRRLLPLAAVLLASCAGVQTGPALTREDYKARLRDVLTLPDVVFLDADETCDCIAVGVATPAAAAAARNYAASAGVPSDRVKIVQAKPVRFFAGLQNQIRPVKGGLQIESRGKVDCTMMATVFNRARAKKGLLTNSHCSSALFSADDTAFYQAGGNIFGNDYVAKEVVDPPPNAALTGCPSGRRCRVSEAAYSEFDIGTTGIVGQLACPKNMCGNGSACDPEMKDLGDKVTITGLAAARPTMGKLLVKIGRSTGWTHGTVTRTCIDVNVKDTDVTLLCQYEVAAAGGPGDSGAPVFEPVPGEEKGILTGILWGGPDDGSSFSFSPIDAIEAEIGALDFY